jgi:hypothetical protein
MPILVTCPCGKQLSARDDLAGKKVKCPGCGGVVGIPAAAGPTPVAIVEAVTDRPAPPPAPVVLDAIVVDDDRAPRREPARPAADPGRPLLWNTAQPQGNVIVVTAGAVYVDTLRGKLVPKVEAGLEEGQAPADLLSRSHQKIPLRQLTRVRYKYSEKVPRAQAELTYDDGRRERRKALVFQNSEQRDQFVDELLTRLGDWPARERQESGPVLFLKYGAGLAAIVIITVLICWAELAGLIRRGPALLILLLDLCGIWGILAIGILAFLIVLCVGIVELLHPPRIITHEPDDDAGD